MQTFTSRPIELKKEIDKIYPLISQPQNLQPILEKMEDKVEDYKVTLTEDQLSFFAPGLGEVIMKRTEMLPPNSVNYETIKSPVPVSLLINLSDQGNGTTLGQVTAKVNVPIFLAGMVKSKVGPALDKVANLLEKIDLDKFL